MSGFRGRCCCLFTRETCRESFDCWRMWMTHIKCIHSPIRLFDYSHVEFAFSHSRWHSRACSRSRSQATGAAVRNCRLWVDSGKVEPAKDEQHKQNREKTEAKASEGNETEHNRIKAETQKQSKPTNEARQGRRRDADDDVLTVTNCSRGSCLGDLLLPRLLGLCSWPENKKKKSRVEKRKEKKWTQPAGKSRRVAFIAAATTRQLRCWLRRRRRRRRRCLRQRQRWPPSTAPPPLQLLLVLLWSILII